MLIRIYSDIHSYQNFHECHTLIWIQQHVTSILNCIQVICSCCLLNWSLGIPHVSLTINAIFIVLKRGNLVAQMLGRRTHRPLWEKIKSTFLVNPALLSPGQPTRDWWWLVRVRPVKQPRNSFQTDLTAEQTSADLLPTGGSAICQIWGQI